MFLSPFFSSSLSSFSHHPYCTSSIFSTLSLHYLLILDIFFSFFLILSFLFSLFFRFPSPLFPFLFPPQLIIPFFLLSSLPPFPFPHHFLRFSSLFPSLITFSYSFITSLFICFKGAAAISSNQQQ